MKNKLAYNYMEEDQWSLVFDLLGELRCIATSQEKYVSSEHGVGIKGLTVNPHSTPPLL